MMNGEIPSVPITTLAGISSLTALLPELPLPNPLSHTVINKSLLFHPKIADEAKQALTSTNDALVSQLAHALRQTNTDHIELKDNLASDNIEGDIPELLKAILEKDPDSFKGGNQFATANNDAAGYNGSYSSPQPGSIVNEASPFVPTSGASNQFQQHYLPFNQEPSATVNGGSPSLQAHLPSHSRQRSRPNHAKPAAAGSPAQASAAPSSSDLSMMRSDVDSSQTRKASDPVVVIEPLQHENVGPSNRNSELTPTRLPSSNQREGLSLTPQVSLTRIDEGALSRKDKKRHRRDGSEVAHYNVVSSPDTSTKLTLKLSKSRAEEKRGTKRRRSSDEDGSVVSLDCDGLMEQATMKDMQEVHGDYAASLSERVKRRRQHAGFDENGDVITIGDDDFHVDQMSGLSKSRDRRRDHDQKKSRRDMDGDEDSKSSGKKKSSHDSHKMKKLEVRVTLEDLMETPTFKKFNSAIDSVLEAAEDTDLTELKLDDDEAAVTDSSESLISKSLLSDLCSEAAKLKTMAVTKQVPCEKLVKVLTILQYSIKDGCKVVPLDENEQHDDHIWRELAMERVICAVDASLAALYIMTSSGMPKEVYIEDVIERVVSMAKIQLKNSIFPEYDPVYRVDPNNKTGIQSHSKLKRAKAVGAKHRASTLLYNKLSDLVGTLSELVDMQELTDTIILQASTLAVSPFFVENISELQLNSLKLVTSIFTRYDKHRQLIIEDILSSLARLPSSKKNLRSYRLNADEQIQMVTALTLQLIQCVVKLPKPERDEAAIDEDEKQRLAKEKAELVDKEVTIITSYENAMRTAHNFLAVFLRKCTSKGEEDYRPLFENFVYDLLATVNKPEWPAAELLLSLLGRLLVQQFSNRSVDMSLRTASLDYLGIVAARLRKDAVSSRLDESIIDDIIEQINEEDDRIDDSKHSKGVGEEDRTQFLQKALLEYLAYNAQNDHALIFSRQFYVGQWFRDCGMEVEKAHKRQQEARKSNKNDDDDDEHVSEVERTKQIQDLVEKRKVFLVEQINSHVGAFASYKPSPSQLDYDKACLATRYLASNRPFSQSFDIYLTQILKVLCETAVAVRTKAMKCLTAVVEADPGILARGDMQSGVHGRFLDQSTSVREAAVELVGKFILIRPELTVQYYDMLSERILDTGISVRKRVIKIFRDICIEQPEFNKIPEMCVKMIRRVNDEEGIKKLVNETFQNMWFTQKSNKDAEKLLMRVMNITDVVAACRDTGYDWFEQLLDNLLKKEESSSSKPVEMACSQIVDCLVDNVLSLEGGSEANNTPARTNRLVSCFTTLFLFCKVKPTLLVNHVTTIQPYLNIKCNSQTDLLVLHNVAKILEMAVPLVEHPSESFLAQLEEDMMRLILKHGMMVLQSCVSCLGAVVNKVTHNFKLVRDCFEKFFGVLSKCMADHQKDKNNPQLASSRPTLLRSLFTVGLLCRHFNFDSEDFGEKKVSIRDKVFDVMMYFIFNEDEDVKHKALTGLGFLVVRHFEFMLSRELKTLYQDYLTDTACTVRMRCQVLRNLQLYLLEEESKMMRAEDEYKKAHSHDGTDLKEMGDVQSGMASTIIQIYLRDVLESFFHSQNQVRMCALSVITLILGQGLVHPVQCVPYLICMGTDCDNQIRIKADEQLKDIEKKYPGFIQMKALQGVKMSFKLQELIQHGSEPVRGIRMEDNPLALNNFIYSLIRSNRNQRRALLTSMLNMFDDTSKVPLSELVFMADNLAHFPYTVQNEPLYMIHQIDILVSVTGSNLMQSVREVFFPGSTDEEGKLKVEDDDEEDIDVLFSKMPEDCGQLQDLYMASQGCLLLLVLKQHLKDMYGFTDNKIQQYALADSAKLFDKPLSRKNGIRFHPKQALDLIKQGPMPEDLDEDARKALIQAHLDFKQLMLSIDPEDDDDEDSKQAGSSAAAAAVGAPVDCVAGGDTASGAVVPASHSMHTDGSGDAAPIVVIDDDNNRNKTSAFTSKKSGFRGGQSFNIPRVMAPMSASIPVQSHSSSSSSDRRHKHRSKPTSRPHTPKAPKPKKKKRKRKYSESDESVDSDDDSDPDFTV